MITLYNTKSARNDINKNLTKLSSFEMVIKDDINILSPLIVLTSDNFVIECNYIYISDFKRYYFVDDKTFSNDGRVFLQLNVDVLQTYKNEIMQLDVIVINNELNGNRYLNNGEYYVNQCTEFSQILNFPNGFKDIADFILITAGG